MVLAEQIKEAAIRRDTLEKCLDIERKRMDLQNEEEKTQEPDFWDDAARAQEQLRRVASIKSWITDYDTIRKEVEDLELMPDFLKEGVISEEEMDAHYAQTIAHIEALELRNMLRRDEDKMGAILDIQAGAGGTEAQDWASMLLRMYTRWCEAHGYKVKTLDFQAGDEVGDFVRVVIARLQHGQSPAGCFRRWVVPGRRVRRCSPRCRSPGTRRRSRARTADP